MTRDACQHGRLRKSGVTRGKQWVADFCQARTGQQCPPIWRRDMSLANKPVERVKTKPAKKAAKANWRQKAEEHLELTGEVLF